MIMMMIFIIIITIAVTIILISSLASLGAWLTPESQSWVSHWEDQELGDRDKWVAVKINGILAILGLVSRIKSYQTLCYHCCQVNIPKCLHKIKRSPNKHGIYQVSIALAERGSGFALWREVGVIDIINFNDQYQHSGQNQHQSHEQWQCWHYLSTFSASLWTIN